MGWLWFCVSQVVVCVCVCCSDECQINGTDLCCSDQWFMPCVPHACVPQPLVPPFLNPSPLVPPKQKDPWFRVDLPSRAEQILLAPRTTSPIPEIPQGAQSEDDICQALAAARLTDDTTSGTGGGAAGDAAPTPAAGTPAATNGGGHQAAGGGAGGVMTQAQLRRAFEAAGQVVTGAVSLQQALGRAGLGGEGGMSSKDVEVLLASVRISLDAVREALGGNAGK